MDQTWCLGRNSNPSGWVGSLGSAVSTLSVSSFLSTLDPAQVRATQME